VDEQLFTKHGDPGRLAHEGRLLERARHPGVVELVEYGGEPSPRLVTRRATGATLADGAPQTVEAIAGVAASLAATLADLHDMGLVHGALAPEHVLLTPRPVLCGLADGGSIGDPAPGQQLPTGFTDPSVPPGAAPDASRDVYALGGLIRWMLARVPNSVRSRAAGSTAALLAISLRASYPDRAQRPSAARVAADIREAVPDATLVARQLRPTAPAGQGAIHAEWLRRAPFRAAIVLLGVTLTIVTVSLLGGSPPSGGSRPTTTAASRPQSESDSRECPTREGPLQADVDGDGCVEALHFARGVLVAGADQWTVSAGADDIATGDWDCDGRATLAFLDRELGAVYRFDVWPDVAVASVPLVARVDGATELRVERASPDACDVLTVVRATGPPEVVA
jgi:hypothetical protein